MNPFSRLRDDPGLVVEGLRDPHALLLELNRLYHGDGDRRYNPAGTDVFEEDWDNLLILDACRHDAYAEHTPFEGPVDHRVSRGSASPEFVRGNFADKTLHDVVYVSGNRWLLSLQDELGCEIHAHRDVERDLYVAHDDVDLEEARETGAGYVPRPETVMEAALEAVEAFPNKRLVVHFMQPHKPYLGPLADRFEYTGGLRETMAASDVDDETLRQAYADTLDAVLDVVQGSLDDLAGKTVVTADHGELLGDRMAPVPLKGYGHPRGVYTAELVEVPWHVVREGPRRSVRADPPAESVEVDDRAVDDSLRALGYVV